jgi:hypothetical protein
VQAGNLALQVLASQGGGRVLNSKGKISTCDADANAFYVLTFNGEPRDGPNEYRALDVKIGKPGLAARTRTGYYTQPEHTNHGGGSLSTRNPAHDSPRRRRPSLANDGQQDIGCLIFRVMDFGSSDH